MTSTFTATPASSAISILAGNGNGTFQPPVKTSIGNEFRGLAVANFDGNGDGVAAADLSDDSISVLEDWNASTGFATNLTYNVTNEPQAVAAADMNGDGKPDLVVVFWNSTNIDVMLNNGDGTFAADYFTGWGSFPSLAVADVNGDGKPDVVVASGNYNAVAVYTNQGTVDGVWQGLATYSAYGSVHGATSPVIGDFNGDGKPDIAVLTGGSGAGSVDLLAGNGDGTFQSAQTIGTVNTLATSLITADPNHDGFLDLVTGNSTGFSLHETRYALVG